MSKLRVAPDFSLPVELVTESVAIVARKRMGKSHTAKKLVEQLHHADQQIVVVDVKGDWWGLRSSADGKGPGLPLIILGGGHGDVPLEVGSGELVARMVVQERVSALLDLSLFRKGEVATFMTAFLETLYRLKAKEAYRTPMMLVLEEADQLAPQKPFKGQERMLGAASDIVRLGGQRGIGIILVTQRTAVLNKDVLTQAGILILLCTTGSQDIDAIDDWIKKHGQPEQRAKVMATIAAMPRGTAWFWAPGWPHEHGIFRQIIVDPCETFDSGATPKPGQRRIMPKTVADVDLEAFRREMESTIEKAKAEDPRELQRQIRELRAELVKAQKATPAAREKRIEVKVAVLSDPLVRRLEVAVRKLGPLEERYEQSAEKLLQGRGRVVDASEAIQRRLVEARAPHDSTALRPPLAKAAHIMRANIPTPPRPTSAHRPSGGVVDLPKGWRIVLTAAAQHGDGVTREQLTVLTGYKRSSRDTYLQKLSERDLVVSRGDRVLATDAGVAALGDDFEPLPTGDALREYWLGELPEGERRILTIVAGVYPKSIERDQISEATEYKRSSRDTYLQKLAARRLITTERGMVRASEELFG